MDGYRGIMAVGFNTPQGMRYTSIFKQQQLFSKFQIRSKNAQFRILIFVWFDNHTHFLKHWYSGSTTISVFLLTKYRWKFKNNRFTVLSPQIFSESKIRSNARDQLFSICTSPNTSNFSQRDIQAKFMWRKMFYIYWNFGESWLVKKYLLFIYNYYY